MNTMPTLPLDIGCRATLSGAGIDLGIEFYVGHTYIWTYKDHLERYRYEPGRFQAHVEKLVREEPRVQGCSYP